MEIFKGVENGGMQDGGLKIKNWVGGQRIVKMEQKLVEGYCNKGNEGS